MPSGLKVQNDYQTHHHHHRGQNRPHHYHIYSPTRPPLEPAEPDYHFFCGREDLIGPPLPRLLAKNVQAVEHLLYGLGKQNVHTTNRKDKLISPA